MTDARKRTPLSLVNFQSRERNGAFGLAARVGERVGERTDQKAEWSGGFGNSSRELQRGSQVLPVWRRSLSRESQTGKSWRRGGSGGERLCAITHCFMLEETAFNKKRPGSSVNDNSRKPHAASIPGQRFFSGMWS